ncbi:PfkB family carbohydrate kinase [Saccharothrix texasensis]|uniref:Sugar/nucleoside kinase (Ribokinase family) n=1 Tax=Saccharothrix texasensis TaxID=103734 RepID=A0A3N1HHD9_9PSEU|nr:PfkB family carbohydrate kinase [Saccharothrix texasensis]ROP41886.1 sugar/nucleoside kinase (ribokinase family) [Saccharothrix texasensis]
MAEGLFVGLSTVDLGYLVAEYPDEDDKVTALEQATAAGGPATNAAVAFAFLAGGQSRLATAVGRHWMAGLIRDDLARHQVELVDLAPDQDGGPPASSIIVSGKTASRTVVSLDATRVQAPAPADPAALLGEAGIVLVDGHQAEPCAAAAAAARAAGVPVVFDGGHWKPTHAELLRHIDIAICSSRYAPPGTADVDETHQYLHDQGVRCAATTAGEGPIRWSTRRNGGVVKPPSVTALDTLGAGDIFHGAFCHYYLRDRDFPRALENAAAVAAASCERFGTRAWMASGRERFA